MKSQAASPLDAPHIGHVCADGSASFWPSIDNFRSNGNGRHTDERQGRRDWKG
jgi:hypothetical protein